MKLAVAAALLVQCAALEVPLYGRRALLSSTATVAIAGCAPRAVAAQRGAEDAYATQTFQETVCTRRTPLGACAEQGVRQVKNGAESAAPTSVPENYDSDLIRTLRERTAANADANAQQVKEITTRNGLGGTFGPFSNEASVMRQDGSFEVISVGRLERLKDAKKVVQNKNGLDTFIEGFDPAAPEKKSGWFGF